jgi:hypothetical protein
VLAAAGDTTPPFRYGAPVDVHAFAYRRDITLSAAGVVEVQLDAAALAHSAPGFADLRIVADGGRQVPYLLRKQDESLAIRVAFERETSSSAGRWQGANVSRYLLRLPYRHLPSAQLVVHTSSRVFSRDVRLETTPPEGDDRQAEVLCSLVWSHTDEGSDAPDLTFDVASLDSPEVHLVIDEGDNSPLPVERPTLLLPSYRLRFARPPGVSLQLVYGNRALDAPRYDVALVPDSLWQAPAAPASVAPERTPPPSRLPAGTAFWAALALAVVVLGVLIARLVRGNPA